MGVRVPLLALVERQLMGELPRDIRRERGAKQPRWRMCRRCGCSFVAPKGYCCNSLTMSVSVRTVDMSFIRRELFTNRLEGRFNPFGILLWEEE